MPMAHGEAILTYEVLLALKGRLEPQVLKDHKVILGQLALKGPQAQRVMMVLLAPKAQLALLALLVVQVHKVQRVMMAPMELPDRKARQVLQGHKVQLALLVLQVPRGLLDLHPLMLGQDTV